MSWVAYDTREVEHLMKRVKAICPDCEIRVENSAIGGRRHWLCRLVTCPKHAKDHAKTFPFIYSGKGIAEKSGRAIFTAGGPVVPNLEPMKSVSESNAENIRIAKSRALGLHALGKWLADTKWHHGCIWKLDLTEEAAFQAVRDAQKDPAMVAPDDVCGKDFFESNRRRMPLCEAHYDDYVKIKARINKRNQRHVPT